MTAGTVFWCEAATLPNADGLAHPVADVRVAVHDGRISAISAGRAPAPTDRRLNGLVIAGLANAHSHAFHRVLRNRTQTERGTFWTWRELMYAAAGRLDPDSYFRVARAVFAEMVLSGMTAVGEFHYVHHQPDGRPYDDPNAMAEALLQAAADAGLRITLLDVLYLHGGLAGDGYAEPTADQRRFCDPSVDAWVERVSDLTTRDHALIGAAVHSVRAVDPGSMKVLAGWADSTAVPVHAHVSEQVLENTQCEQYHGVRPIGLLDHAGLLSPRFTAVHATHLTSEEVTTLGTRRARVCMCPTTERDLADGVGPSRRLVHADVGICLGSDSHAVIDHFEEARAVELNERLVSHDRGVHSAGELLRMATVEGHRSLGWSDAGVVEVGARADMVAVSLDSVRTAGTAGHLGVEAAVFAATASDVTDVVIDGRIVVEDGRHTTIDVPAELSAAIGELMAS